MSDIVERFARIHRDAPDRPLVHLPAASTTLTASRSRSGQRRSPPRTRAPRIGTGHAGDARLRQSPAVFPFWLACLSARIPVMPVDVDGTSAEMLGLATRFGATVAVLRRDNSLAAGTTESFVDGLVAVRFAVESRPSRAICRGAAALKLTSGSTGLPKATFTTERELVTRHRAHRRSDGDRAGAHPDRRGAALARLRTRQRAHAGADARHSGDPPRRIRAARPAQRTHGRTAPTSSKACRSCSSTLPPLRRRAAGRRGCAGWSAPGPGSSRRRCGSSSSDVGVKVHSFYGTSRDRRDRVRRQRGDP